MICKCMYTSKCLRHNEWSLKKIWRRSIIYMLQYIDWKFNLSKFLNGFVRLTAYFFLFLRYKMGL